ncbi:unnamed protein product, partial [Protopolystoma xenopodis]
MMIEPFRLVEWVFNLRPARTPAEQNLELVRYSSQLTPSPNTLEDMNIPLLSPPTAAPITAPSMLPLFSKNASSIVAQVPLFLQTSFSKFSRQIDHHSVSKTSENADTTAESYSTSCIETQFKSADPLWSHSSGVESFLTDCLNSSLKNINTTPESCNCSQDILFYIKPDNQRHDCSKGIKISEIQKNEVVDGNGPEDNAAKAQNLTDLPLRNKVGKCQALFYRTTRTVMAGEELLLWFRRDDITPWITSLLILR